jgi:hypothetical protein
MLQRKILISTWNIHQTPCVTSHRLCFFPKIAVLVELSGKTPVRQKCVCSQCSSPTKLLALISRLHWHYKTFPVSEQKWPSHILVTVTSFSIWLADRQDVLV